MDREHTFLDTNIIIRFLTSDDLKKQEAAAALFERIEKKEEMVYAPESVICDAVFVLASPKHYNKSREQIRDLLFPLVSLENLKISNRRVLLRALDIYVAYPIDFSDALLKATMEAADAQIIYSYDTDFDRFSDITRKESEEPRQEKKLRRKQHKLPGAFRPVLAYMTIVHRWPWTVEYSRRPTVLC